MPSVRPRLASALGRRDEEPNVALAVAVARRRDRAAVDELAALLRSGSKAEQSDAIKVLYEVGARDPALIAAHWRTFAELLGSRHGRLVWGAMTALDAIAAVVPDEVARALPAIVAAAAGDSVIARDHAVGVLTQLVAHDRHRRRAAPALLAILRDCPDLQFPMYCERCADAVTGALRARCAAVATERLPRLPRASLEARVAKVLQRWQGARQSARRAGGGKAARRADARR